MHLAFSVPPSWAVSYGHCMAQRDRVAELLVTWMQTSV